MADSLKEKTVKGLMWGALSNGGMQLLNVVFGIIIARQLCPSDYGIVAMITIFSTIATALQESGFITALVNRKNASNLDYSSVFWFNVSASIFIYIVLWFCAPLIATYNNQPAITSLARYAFIGFLFGSLTVVPRAMLIKELKVKEQAISNLVALFISGIVSIIMAMSGMAYWGLVTQTNIYVLLVVLFSWHFSHFKPTFAFSISPIKEMFRFSCKMLFTKIFIQINRFAFETLLGRFYREDKIGYYSQANKWNVMGSNMITGMIQDISQPMFVKIGNETERQRRAFRKMLRFTSFLSFPLMFGLSFIAPEFIPITISEKYAASIPLMQILCIGGAFLPIATLYYNFIISQGKSEIYMWNIICQSVFILADLFFVLNFDLTFWGCSGIQLMTIIYTIIIVLWTFVWHYFIRCEIGLTYIEMLKDVLPFILIASASMIATHYILLGISNMVVLLIAKILVAAIIYIGLTYISGAKILRESISYIMRKDL